VEDTRVKPNNILNTKLQQLQNKTWKDFFLKCKRYPMHETTWGKTMFLRLTSLIFVNEKNDIF
jgi:hypothetical protein